MTAAATGNTPTRARLLLQVFLPFAFAYFLSYIFRGVNAVIFPYLERDVGISAGDLGLLTSAFFLSLDILAISSVTFLHSSLSLHCLDQSWDVFAVAPAPIASNIYLL